MKPIPFKTNLKVAEKVRRAVNRLNQSSLLSSRAHWECFDNCREQGYVLITSNPNTLDTLHIAFSECRNSDNIVVYVYDDVAFPSNLPEDGSWNNRRDFRSGDFEGAASYILEKATCFVTQYK